MKLSEMCLVGAEWARFFLKKWTEAGPQFRTVVLE